MGYICLVLHAHLPFVHHPEYNDFLEEDWLFEAITETYIPLVKIFSNLIREKIPFNITMSLTPSLCEMLSNETLKKRYKRYLNNLIGLLERELENSKHNRAVNYEAALMYRDKLNEVREIYEIKYGSNLLKVFREIMETGNLEIITSSATHAYFPLITRKEIRRAQIKTAVKNYIKHFGKKPDGIWLPECAYSVGVEKLLKEEGLKYFFVDTHGLMFASPRPKYGVFAPVYCRNGVAVFGRDLTISRQVWSSDGGYPGDFFYREFYRDIGYDADYEYIRPYLHSDGSRSSVGIKYHRITGKMPLTNKEYYNPDIAFKRAADHAEDYIYKCLRQSENIESIINRKPLVVSLYDAELFGHWWYEGPVFLDNFFRKIYEKNVELRTVTPSMYLKEFPENQVVKPIQSSWGHKGYNEVWLNSKNDWLYRHYYNMEKRMLEIAHKIKSPGKLVRRAINQAVRELFLAQSSDWAFMMTASATSNYAEKRVVEHIKRFNELYSIIIENRIEEKWLEELELKDSIFPELDYAVLKKN